MRPALPRPAGAVQAARPGAPGLLGQARAGARRHRRPRVRRLLPQTQDAAAEARHQLRARGREGDREKDLPRARKVATNLLAWAMQTRRPGGKLSRPQAADQGGEDEPMLDQLVRDAATRGRAARLAFGRLVHRGDWDADPDFFPALAAALGAQRAVPQFERELPIVPTSEDLFHVPIVFANGHDDPALRPGEYAHLRIYVQNGGFLLLQFFKLAVWMSAPGGDTITT